MCCINRLWPTGLQAWTGVTPGSSTQYSQMDLVGQQIEKVIESKRAVVGNHGVSAGAQAHNNERFVGRGRETL